MRVIETDLLEQRGQDWFYKDAPLSDLERNIVYNGLDCMVTLEVSEALRTQFDDVTLAAYEFEKELMGPVLEMNMRGVLIDEHYRRKLIVEYEAESDRLEDNLNRILNDGLGVFVNWRSNPGLLDLFYNILSLPPIKKRNARGEFTPTVNREALEQLEDNFYAQPIIAHILSLRDIGKRISFLKTEVDPDGRIRTSYNIGGTTTGRLSSSFSDFGTGTNLQNIEPRLRRIFIADPGYKFCNIDLEQSDSRAVGAIIWNLFHDGKYLDACESGDLHSSVSNMVWPGINPRDTFYRHFSYRDAAKRLGHATNFNGQPPEISKQVKIPLPLVKEFQPLYLAQFPGIAQWWEQRRRVLLNEGRLTSMLGMKRCFFGRRNDNQTFKKLIAFEPQNTTAWTINRGMLRVWKANICQLLLQVHDSIVVQYPEQDEDKLVPHLRALIEETRQLSFGRIFCIPAEPMVGWNWAYRDPKDPEDNPDGLIKYGSHDSRSRSVQPPTTKKLGTRILQLHRELSVPTPIQEVGSHLNYSS